MKHSDIPPQTEPSAPILGDYLNTPALAVELGVAEITLKRWRLERRGPPFSRIGRRVLYRRASVRNWLAAQEQVRA